LPDCEFFLVISVTVIQLLVISTVLHSLPMSYQKSRGSFLSIITVWIGNAQQAKRSRRALNWELAAALALAQGATALDRGIGLTCRNRMMSSVCSIAGYWSIVVSSSTVLITGASVVERHVALERSRFGVKGGRELVAGALTAMTGS
jgi:hypothetical protein